MKLKIISGELIVEIVEDDAFGIEEAKRKLKLVIDGKGEPPVSEPTKYGRGKLGRKPRVRI